INMPVGFRFRKLVFWIWAISAALVTSAATAEDVYYSVPVSRLKLTEGKLPADTDNSNDRRFFWLNNQSMSPRAVLDGEGEVYVQSLSPWGMPAQRAVTDVIAVRVPAERKITGTLFYPKADWSGQLRLKFAVEDKPTADAKTAFSN